jgi:hypothetical protein
MIVNWDVLSNLWSAARERTEAARP